jgi:hypothetical protein
MENSSHQILTSKNLNVIYLHTIYLTYTYRPIQVINIDKGLQRSVCKDLRQRKVHKPLNTANAITAAKIDKHHYFSINLQINLFILFFLLYSLLFIK